MDKEILNLKELSDYLNCSQSAVRKMKYEAKIPFFKIGTKIMFERKLIDKWISSQRRGLKISGSEECINGNLD